MLLLSCAIHSLIQSDLFEKNTEDWYLGFLIGKKKICVCVCCCWNTFCIFWNVALATTQGDVREEWDDLTNGWYGKDKEA